MSTVCLYVPIHSAMLAEAVHSVVDIANQVGIFS